VRFLFVDRIVSLAPGREIVALRKVPHDDDYFEDHFPGFPVVPGVLLTESMGQAAAKCLDAERKPRGKAMLARIVSATFRQWVRPGDELELRATIGTNRDRFATADCTAHVEGLRVAETKLLFSFVALETLSPGFKDTVLEEFMVRNP